jgi:excisionase family DNA binding protein
VSELHDLLPALARAIEELVDTRIAHALAEHDGRDNASPWLPLSAAAKYAYVSERTLERMVQRGQLRTTTLGRRRLVNRDDLDAFLEEAAGRT